MFFFMQRSVHRSFSLFCKSVFFFSAHFNTDNHRHLFVVFCCFFNARKYGEKFGRSKEKTWMKINISSVFEQFSGSFPIIQNQHSRSLQVYNCEVLFKMLEFSWIFFTVFWISSGFMLYNQALTCNQPGSKPQFSAMK